MTQKEAAAVLVLSIAIGSVVLSFFSLLSNVVHTPTVYLVGIYYAVKYSVITSAGLTWIITKTDPEIFRAKALRVLSTWP